MEAAHRHAGRRILALEAADKGELKVFSDYVGFRSAATLLSAIQIARKALSGQLNRPNGNGGRTIGDEYSPPEAD